MASPFPTEQVYNDGNSAGVIVIVSCGMLSVISVLSMFLVLGLSAVRRRHSSDETPFIRTHTGKYFLSLLICNFAQAVGAILNIPWLVQRRVYTGGICEVQATMEQIGIVGTAIFSFLIATHTFSLLFLRSQWSGRTSCIILIVSWGVLILDLCIGEFALARRADYGIVGYWCWITPASSTEIYTSDYLFMFASAGFSFILYLLVFFRLRGNITLSGGYKVHFHQRPKVRVGRTNTGAYVVTDDRRVESHLTNVGKQMLWHPLAYTVLALPFAVVRCSSSGESVTFSVATTTSALYVLGGFVNTVLFCTTRNVLPERWRQRFGIPTTLDSHRGDASMPSRRSSTRLPVESGARKGVVGTGMDSVVLNITMEKDFDIQSDGRGRSPSSLTFSSLSTPTRPLRAYGGKQRADSERYHIRHMSFSPLRNERLSIRSGVDGDGEDGESSSGLRPAGKVERNIKQIPDRPVHPCSEQENAIHESPPGLRALASFHPLGTCPPANTGHEQQSSVLTFETAVYRTSTHLSWGSGDCEGSGSGVHWTGHKKRTQQMGLFSAAVDQHPYAMENPGTDPRRPSRDARSPGP